MVKNSKNQQKVKEQKELLFLLFLVIILAIFSSKIIFAIPQGLSEVINIENSTKGSTAGLMVNESQGGGYIYTMNITGVSQNSRWKAYVGNVSGKLTLDDSTGSTIYDWSLTSSLNGKLFATRNSTTPDWTNVNCTWTFTADYDTNNRSIEELENIALSHTNPDDNISATFNTRNNRQFTVGTITIAANTCYTIHTYVGNVSQSDVFEEILIHDGALPIYTTILETGEESYRNLTYYDFQLLLPEEGSTNPPGSTAYYFYVEFD